jgi:hypothetical protein
MGIQVCALGISRHPHAHMLFFAPLRFAFVWPLQSSTFWFATCIFCLTGKGWMAWIALPDSMDVLGGHLARRRLHLTATTRSAWFGTAHASTSSPGMTSWVALITSTSVCGLLHPMQHFPARSSKCGFLLDGNSVSLLASIVTFNSVLALECPSGHIMAKPARRKRPWRDFLQAYFKSRGKSQK